MILEIHDQVEFNAKNSFQCLDIDIFHDDIFQLLITLPESISEVVIHIKI